jgi:formiminoglutamase
MINNLLDFQQDSILDSKIFEDFQYGHSILQYKGQEVDLKTIAVAIMSWGNSQYSDIQQSLYSLASNFKTGKVIDLGIVHSNLVPLVELIDILLQNDVFPIVITPSSDAIEGQLKAYEQRHEMLSLAIVDSKIPYTYQSTSEGLINKLLLYHPHLLFHLNCIGHQSYLNDKNAINFLEDKHFETHRLGNIQARLEEIEPMVRDIDLAAFSLASIRSADAPANLFKNPNGFGAAEACKVMRYITMSDQLSSLCIYGFHLSIDNNKQTANMIAQLIWFGIEGFFARTQEFPVNKKDLRAYVVDNKDLDMAISFYKSTKSNRWWFEIPKALYPKHQLIACSYQDYQTTCEGDLPDRLLNAINRLT